MSGAPGCRPEGCGFEPRRSRHFNMENKCPSCGSPVVGTMLGEVCSNNNCGYVDGIVLYTDKTKDESKSNVLRGVSDSSQTSGPARS
jgi:hypothetical protein